MLRALPLPLPSLPPPVDIEEALYQHAASLGITLITITQVGGWVAPPRFVLLFLTIDTLRVLRVVVQGRARGQRCLPRVSTQDSMQRTVFAGCLACLAPPPTRTASRLQRTALVKYHQRELRLVDGEGDWQLREIHESRQAAATSGGGPTPRIEELPA